MLVRLVAWLGGAAFVGSLAYLVWFYAVPLGYAYRRTDGVLARSLLVDTLLFGTFAAHHSLFAREGVKRLVTRIVAPGLERSVYVWISSVLLVLVCWFWLPVPGRPLYSLEGAARWLAHAVQVFGVGLIVRSASILDALELAGIRQAERRAPAPTFRVVGAYRWIRHPIYLGWVLVFFGAPHMTPSRLAFAAISSAYLAIAIPWEERSLVRSFGDEYRRYQRQVRWRMLPFLY